MTRNLDLLTQTNWALAYSISIPATITASVAGKNYYDKITPIRPGVILDKPILAIAINTIIPAGKRWFYAGSLSRFSSSALGEILIEDRKPLFLGRFNLVITDNLSNNYQLEINIPSWFISCNLSIYQYEGSDQTLIQQELDVIKAAVIPSQ
ncbi:hypothetical protein [Nostoc sp.]|uniref:hypothetical protein n=1 Tax=Nostoc sp. TaxID=1180 RepID=UPI002FFB863C